MSTTKDKFKHIDPNILESFLDGTGDQKKKQQIANWFSDLWANEEMRKITFERWNKTPEKLNIKGYDKGRIHDRIYHILRLEEFSAQNKKARTIKFVTHFQRIAAIIVIPLLIFSLVNLRGSLTIDSYISDASIYSPIGARTSFTLPDGSTGWLNGDSYLNYPSSFTGKNRTVELIGEAYFNVVKNPQKTFIVTAGELEVKVIGTSFNLMAYPDEQTMEVTLEKGTVEVYSQDAKGNEISMGTMTPGERGVLWRGTSIFKTDPVDITRFISWKEGRLVFRNEPMEQVVRKMNRWYNVNIVIKDNRLKDFNYTATFSDEKLDEVLNIFQYTSPIVVKAVGREIEPDGTYGKRTIELYFQPDYYN